MAEFHTVKSGTTLRYEGYTDFSRFWHLIRKLLEKRGYEYLEHEHNEIVKQDGKDIYLHVDADRTVSDYAKLRLVIKCTVNDLCDAKVETDSGTKRMDDCELSLVADSYVITDYQGRYQDKAWLFFLRTIAEKFLYRREISKFSHMAERDHDDLMHEARKYLNVFSA